MNPGNLISLLLAVIVFGVLMWAAQRIMAVLPIAEPWKTIAYVIIVLIGVFFAVSIIAQILGAPIPGFRWTGSRAELLLIQLA